MTSRARISSRGSSALLLAFLLASLIVAPRAAEGDAAGAAMRLLNNHCFACHNPEKRKGSLVLTSREAMLEGSGSGSVVTEGAPEESLLFKVLAADSDPHMPPRKQLSPEQIAVIGGWIRAGAPWDQEALAKAAALRDVRLEPLPPGYQPVLAMALSPDETRLAFGRGAQLAVVDVSAANHPIREIAAHIGAVRSVAWSPDGEWLASGSFREVKVWKAGDLSLAWSSTNFAGRVTALRFSPFGGALMVAEGGPVRGGWVRLLEAGSGGVLGEWQAHEDSIYSLAASPDGGVLATAGNDGLVKVWELVSRQEIGQFEGHSGAVLGVAFNTNASELVTVSLDKELRIWDIQTRQSIVTIGPRADGYSAVAWTADGQSVLAGTDDGRLIRFWDFKRHTGAQSSSTGRQDELARWDEPVLSLAASRDASTNFAGTQDGTVYMLSKDGKRIAAFEPPPPEPPSPDVPSFVRDVLPVMAKAGCMAGSCHAKPKGQNGFKLSVFSFDPKSDFDEIVKEGRGRRVFPAAPAESLLLLKPTMAVDHGGGQRLEKGSEAYELIERWIRGGMPYQQPDEPVLAEVSVEPAEARYGKGEERQLRVTAHYSDESERDVTALADYVPSDEEFAAVTEDGLLKVGALSGEGVIVARYMGYVDSVRVTVPVESHLPPEKYESLPVNNFIDWLAYAHFQKLGLFPSDECTDAEFIRRSSLDAIGMLPTPEEVRVFLADRDPGKRRRWIEHLLRHPIYADYWANKWADLLRPNPDRVGVKSVYMLDQWLRQAFRENRPMDQFAAEILTAEGSNHRYGPAVVYRDRREPSELTTMFSQVFLGVRMECAKCHHHPNEKWSQKDFYQFAAFFGPVEQKGAGLSPPISAGTETFYFKPGGEVKHPVTGEVMEPRPLDGPAVEKTGSDPRESLAAWLTAPDNPYFARAMVNRVWEVFFGRGFVEPVDDFRASNPVTNEPLLDALARDFAGHGYNQKHLIRTILNSRLYQLSSAPNESNLADTRNFSRSYRRRLLAEVLLDAVDDVTGVRGEYNGSPPGTRAIQTWSYKVPSHFMNAFGRPDSSSDCPCERDFRPSVVQSLHMMNSTDLQRKLSSPEGRVHRLAESSLTPAEIVTELYLLALSRYPAEEELKIATEAFNASGASRQTAAEDVLWALLNSAEFVFNH